MAGRGKSCQMEQSIMQKLHEMVPTQVKVYYVVWKYAKHLLPKKIDTFEDLTREYKGFTEGMDEAKCESWLAEEAVQAAAKYLLKRLHGQKMIELYEIYFEKAKDDVQAFQAFSKFSEKFFSDDSDDELRTILNGIRLNEENENDGGMQKWSIIKQMSTRNTPIILLPTRCYSISCPTRGSSTNCAVLRRAERLMAHEYGSLTNPRMCWK